MLNEGRTSLVPDTLRELSSDPELQELSQRVRERGQKELSREEKRKRQRSLDELGAPPFQSVLQVEGCPLSAASAHQAWSAEALWHACQEHGVSPLRRGPASTLQLNIGLYCNQACSHCHVESSPLRTEAMDRRTAERCLQLLEASRGSVRTLDLTGGAPELSPQFRSGAETSSLQMRATVRVTIFSCARWRAAQHQLQGLCTMRGVVVDRVRFLVEEARALGVEVIDRCNLTVLQEPGQEGLADFLAAHQVPNASAGPVHRRLSTSGPAIAAVLAPGPDHLARCGRCAWWPRCPATARAMWRSSAAAACFRAASRRCTTSTPLATAGPAAAWPWTWSTTPMAPSWPRLRAPWRCAVPAMGF